MSEPGYTCSEFSGGEAAFQKLLADLKEKGATLTLSKRGRGYKAKFESRATERRETKEVSLIRSAGRPVLGLSQYKETGGKPSVLIDEFRIDRAKK